ncbi:lysine N(6)-hydroxylase/L-ornithine N(5)-oxygenase family protein [Paenibacillus sp. MMS18-CY102]|uniref:lysine N(6)-hydroxylase/L-ornithine N(5)-oxygenase family protein n=1 Tax=Paenibacillus sp. MMS18-CY102 TaxID=2682849 RepID=UPI001365E74B|nr:lysine N(6)-hydroxylase/L-ornithine N(5)-oxygenase family protein [Paenibacillus sp. MMS18-CY102]MWC29952.1 SidA/IucD/PvdA family monooxygenase [Paenibacillus sp. MMS18-CY102]
MTNHVHDVIGVGIGPFNLGLAALLEGAPELDAVFFERKPSFEWHAGMLIEGTTLQVPFFADLVTMADPTHRLSFLNYLHEQGRLYHFYFLEKFLIPRREYNEYCRWAAEQLPSCRFGMDVVAIRPSEGPEGANYAVETRDVASGEVTVHYTRDLVLGVGSVPNVLSQFRGLPAEDIFHSASFMDRLPRCREAQSITVIGSGQSAAEVFLQLLGEQREHGYRLDWLTRSSGFFPMEYSKLGLEHFSPDYTEYFYGLPQETKDKVRSKQHLLYKGISAKTIGDIYDAMYDASIGGEKPPVRLLAHAEVVEITPQADGEGYRLDVRHLEQQAAFERQAEVVIMATGYAHKLPACIEPLGSLIPYDGQGRLLIDQDYRVQLAGTAGGRIFVQNGELHTHGIGAPDLGLGAHRSSVIVNGLAGREVYKVRERNVFQQFGVKGE